MNGGEFLNRVRVAFGQELGSDRLRLVSHTYRQEAYGNATAILEAPKLLLMIERDRSFHYANVAHLEAPGEWSRLQKAIAAASGRSKPDYYYPQGDEIEIEAAAALYRENWETLARGYSKDWRETSKRLKLVNREYSDRMIEWHSSLEGRKAYAEMKARTDQQLANPSPELLAAFKEMGINPPKP